VIIYSQVVRVCAHICETELLAMTLLNFIFVSSSSWMFKGCWDFFVNHKKDEELK